MQVHPKSTLTVVPFFCCYILMFLIVEMKSFKFGENKNIFFDNKRQLLNNLRFQDPMFRLVQPGQVMMCESQSNLAFFGKTINGDLQFLGYENQNEINILEETKSNVFKNRSFITENIEFVRIYHSIIFYKLIVSLEPYLPERIDNMKSFSFLKECFDEILGYSVLDISL